MPEAIDAAKQQAAAKRNGGQAREQGREKRAGWGIDKLIRPEGEAPS